MADENEIEIKVTARNDSPAEIRKSGKAAKDTSKTIGKSMDEAGGSFDKAGKQSRSFADRMGGVAAASFTLTGGLGDLADSIGDVTDLQRAGERRADEIARAYLDVEQAQEDMAQAAEDAKQAQHDLNEAQTDGKQSALDYEQAQIDQTQAVLDAELAQTEYDRAVKEHGKNSAEARQAAIDLQQAQADVTQANIDAEQAQNDQSQAALDSAQATRDLTQADLDARDAQLNLNEAQRDADPPAVQTWTQDVLAYAPAVTAAAGAIELLTAATSALNLATIKTTAATVASKAAQVAATVATGAVTASQWLWNAAMTANPIGLIIVAIGALVAAIVWVATKTTWFQSLWSAIWDPIQKPAVAFGSWFKNTLWGSWLKPAFEFIIGANQRMLDVFRAVPGKLKSFFSGVADILTWPFRQAVQDVKNVWNSTIGGRGFSIPGWLGGGSFEIPRLARGGIASGMAIVGERGAELLDLPAGSHVRPEANTQLALAAGRPPPATLEMRFAGDTDTVFAAAFMRMLRDGLITIRPQALEA